MPRPDATQKLAAAAPKSGPSRSLVATVVAVVAVLAIAGVVIVSQLGKSGSTTATGQGAPAQATPAGALGFGQAMVLNPGAPASAPVLDLYEDPQCPVCKQFEAAFGTAVDQLVSANEAKVIVHTMTFLDTNLRNDASTRAANGAYCAADQGKFRPFMEATYAGQPAEEGKGWTDAQLKDFATSAGVGDVAAWQTCQSALTYKAHAAAVNDNSIKGGVHGTPTLVLNGTTIDLNTLGTLDAAGFRALVKAATK